MFQIERQEKILEYVNNVSKVTINELSSMFGMSLVTIRADVKDLAKRGLLIRTHGGALSVQQGINSEIPAGIRSILNVESKQLIAQAASELITNGDIVILDSGSTTLEIARRISARNVTVITNDLKIGALIADRGDISLIMTGGVQMPLVYSLIGSDTIDFLKRIKVNKLFLGCDAIDFDWGISNRSVQEVAVKKTMMEAARDVIAVADHSKFEKKVFAHLCNLQYLDMLITDKLSPERIEQLVHAEVKVLVADSKEAKLYPPEKNNNKHI